MNKVLKDMNRLSQISNKINQLNELSQKIEKITRNKTFKTLKRNQEVLERISNFPTLLEQQMKFSQTIPKLSRDRISEVLKRNQEVLERISNFPTLLEQQTKLAQTIHELSQNRVIELLNRNQEIRNRLNNYSNYSHQIKISKIVKELHRESRISEIFDSIEKLKENSLEEIFANISSDRVTLDDSEKIKKRKKKKSKFITFNENIKRDIVININFPYSEEVANCFKEIGEILNLIKKGNKKSIIYLLFIYLFAVPFRDVLIDKLTTEILKMGKQEAKKMIKIYKETNYFGTFSNLGIITKNNVVLYDSRKGEKMVTLNYGQVVSYEKIKGRYILIKYRKNENFFEGIILKKYLKKLDM